MPPRMRRVQRAAQRQLFAAELAAAESAPNAPAAAGPADTRTDVVADVNDAALALVAMKAAPSQPGLADLLARIAKGAAAGGSSGPAKRKRGGVEDAPPRAALAAPAKPGGKRPRACRQAQHEQEAAEVAGLVHVETRCGRITKRFRIVAA